MTNVPLLASLGSPVKPVPGGLADGEAPDALTTDDRALDAALEFASLLLETGADSAAGKMLPPGGKILPDGGAEGLPVMDVPVATVEGGPAGAPALVAETPESIIASILSPQTAAADGTDMAELGRHIAGQIRRAQSGATPGAPATAIDESAVTLQSPQPAAVLVAANAALADGNRGRNPDKDLIALGAVRDLAGGLGAEPPQPAAGAARAPASVLPAVQDSAALTGRSLVLDVPMGDQDWGRQFSERVGWVIHARVPSAQLRLNPEHLGPIEMSIEVDDQNARVNFVAAHGMTRDAIEQSLPRLREMLEQQGLNLQQADVSGGDSRTRDDGDRALADEAAGAAEASPASDGDEPAAESKSRVSHAVGLIDTFV